MLFNDDFFSCIDYIALDCSVIVTDELEICGRKWSCLILRLYPIVCLDILRKITKTSVRMTDFRDKIRTRRPQNTKVTSNTKFNRNP
jgi:hypothetical protein